MKFVWPPIAKALDERAAKVAREAAAAERGKSDFEQAEKKVAELLAKGVIRFPKWLPTPKNCRQNCRRSQRTGFFEAARTAGKGRCGAGIVPRTRIPARAGAVLAVKGAESICAAEVDASKHAKLLDTLKQEL